jgi:hypothetical protein
LDKDFIEDFFKRFEVAVKANSKCQLAPNGFIAYDDFLTKLLLVNKFADESTNKKRQNFRNTRRSLLKNNNL